MANESQAADAAPGAEAAAAQATVHAGFLKNNLREYGMLISLVAIMVLFQVLTDGTLMQPLNLTNLVLQNSYIVIMALGMLLVIVAGHIDLSVGSVCGFIGALAAVLMVEYDWHFVPDHRSPAWSPAARSARRRAGSSPTSASRPSSSRWPACWCSRGWRWRCCRASRSGRSRWPSSG